MNIQNNNHTRSHFYYIATRSINTTDYTTVSEMIRSIDLLMIRYMYISFINSDTVRFQNQIKWNWIRTSSSLIENQMV